MLAEGLRRSSKGNGSKSSSGILGWFGGITWASCCAPRREAERKRKEEARKKQEELRKKREDLPELILLRSSKLLGKEEMKRQKELQEQRIKEGKAVFMVRKAGCGCAQCARCASSTSFA